MQGECMADRHECRLRHGRWECISRPDSLTPRAQSKLALLAFEAEAGLTVLDLVEIKCRKSQLDLTSSRCDFAKLGLIGHQAE